MPLYKSRLGDIRQIKEVSGNEKIKKFLFSLGCAKGEQITLISILAGNYIISVKNIRYAIDKNMAKSIELV